MSRFVTQAHQTKFENNLRLQLQQKDAKLLRAVTERDVSGSMVKLEDVIGAVPYLVKRARHEDTKYVETPHDGRWLAMPAPIFYSDLVDKEDKLASGIDIQGAYVKAGQQAIARGTDDAILLGVFGTAQTGEKGTVLTPMSATNVVPVNEGATGPVGLTVNKLAAASEILRRNYVDIDDDELYVAITSRQHRNLLNEVQATNRDYGATGTEIRDGKLARLFGFTFVHIELSNPMLLNAAPLTLDANGYRKVPFWSKSGVLAAFWERDFSRVTEESRKHFSAQIYARRIVGATRTDESKVGYITCAE